jgi:hypothetical protein
VIFLGDFSFVKIFLKNYRVYHRVGTYIYTEVSFLLENRKVVFTKIAGGHVLSLSGKERHSPPWNIKFQYVFVGVMASLCRTG